MATAEILKVAESGGTSTIYIIIGSIFGAIYKLGEVGMKLFTSELNISFYISKWLVSFGCLTSPALFGVGYIINLKIALIVFTGSAISFWIGVWLF